MSQHEDPHLIAIAWVLLRNANDSGRLELLPRPGDGSVLDALADMLAGVLINDLRVDPAAVMQMWQRQHLQRLTDLAKDHHHDY